MRILRTCQYVILMYLGHVIPEMKRILLLLTLVLPAITAFPQLYVGAELRPRLLVENGYGLPKPREDPALAYITQRTRLNLDFRQGLFETYISVQDVRFWGGDNNYQAGGSYGQSGSLSLHQGWFLVKPLPWLSLKAGRQLFNYDDQRILSSRPWNDYQVTYDALFVKAEYEGHRMDLGLSWNAFTRDWQRHAVSWSNHLNPQASEIMLQLERDADRGDPPTERLEADWRERMEDVVWALVNSPEYVFIP